MGRARRTPIASDDLPARESGEWARRKLQWLDIYLPAALTATKAKLDRVYVDLFAGPGMNVDGAAEFEGGALRALRACGRGHDAPAFTHAVLVNIDATDHAALTRRVDMLCESRQSRVPREQIELIHGDANALVSRIMANFHQRAYLLVFADIERPKDLPWTTVSALRAQGHESVDLYVLFPLEMGLNRLTPYRPDRRNAPVLTAFFGTDRWGEVADARTTPAQSAAYHRGMQELYCSQLRTLWEKADVAVDVNLRGRHGLYRMLFAASNEAALRIAAAARTFMAEKGQFNLLP